MQATTLNMELLESTGVSYSPSSMGTSTFSMPSDLKVRVRSYQVSLLMECAAMAMGASSFSTGKVKVYLPSASATKGMQSEASAATAASAVPR